MSRYNIPAMQASGMTTQQINNYIKQQDAKIYGSRGGRGPKVPPKPIMGGINPNAKPPSGIDLEKIRQGVQSLPKGIMDDDFVPKTPLSNMPFGQRLQGMMQSFGQLGQNNASMMKKGGEAKKYTKGGKINLDACGVSTGGKSNKCPSW